MFDVLLVVPGGPGAELEAKRFNEHAKIFTFNNSASERGCPPWFNELSSEHTFDLNDLQVNTCTDMIIGNDSAATLVKIGYIGSPENLKDLKIKGVLTELLDGLSHRGAEIYAGHANAALGMAPPVLQLDLRQAEADMFQILIVAPGGPGAELEAKRFNKKAKI